MGDFFSSTTKKMPEPTIKETPWGPEMRSYLTNLMSNSQAQQFAPMTANEQTGQNLLGTYLGSGTPEAYTLGMNQLRNTLTGQYDPNTSQYYQGLRAQMQTGTNQGMADLQRRQQLNGFGVSGPAYRAQGEFLNTANNQANTLLGSLYEQERQKQAQAANQALAYAQYGDQSQLAKLAAAQQYGSLPRDIQNQRNAADLANQQYRSQLAQMLLQYQPWYQQQYRENPSMFSQIIGGVADVWGAVMGGGGGFTRQGSQGVGGGQTSGSGSLSSMMSSSPYASYTPNWSPSTNLSYGSSNNYGLSLQ